MVGIALHEVLKRGRKSKGWTQQKAAANLGISQKRISQIETGELPSADLLLRAAEAYGLEYAELLPLLESSPTDTSSKLSSQESQLISAIRAGDTSRAYKLFAGLIRR